MPATTELPVTQIIHLRLAPSQNIRLTDRKEWQDALTVCEGASGFKRLYWGRSHEHPEHLELHIERQTLDQHQQFLNSQRYRQFLSLIRPLIATDASPPIIRHARMSSWTPKDSSLARGAPFTGTAIYFNTTEAWTEGAWPLWTHVVRHIDGCMGCSGGPLLEPLKTVPGPLKSTVAGDGRTQSFKSGFIVYVGWETTEKHHAYHHTKHFAEHSVILRCGNDGYAEYGHIVFEGSREAIATKL